MPATNYLKDRLLGASLNGGTYIGPNTLYLALFTTDPGDAGLGTEVSDPAYVRQVVLFNTVTNGSATNTNLVEFEAAEVNYGTITHIGILDSATGGNMLFYEELDMAVIANEGTSVKVDIGGLTISLE